MIVSSCSSSTSFSHLWCIFSLKYRGEDLTAMSVWSVHHRADVLQMLATVSFNCLCTHVPGLSVFSERWILVVFDYYIFLSMQYWKHIYWIYILKESILYWFHSKEKNHCASRTVLIALQQVWFSVCVTCLNLFYLIWRESLLNFRFSFFFSFSCLCPILNNRVTLTKRLFQLVFNLTPYVLMPSGRVWFVPVVQRKIFVS